jgi:ABC-type multidrug transport system ATPase subunit
MPFSPNTNHPDLPATYPSLFFFLSCSSAYYWVKIQLIMDHLIIKDLSKTYLSRVKALQKVSLQIPVGLFGLLGPNGAGKSTLLHIIATLLEADSGSIQLGALNISEHSNEFKKVLGFLPQQFGVYPTLSAEVLLKHLAVLKGIIRREEREEIVHALLQKVNLYGVRKQKLGEYSGGMKQRFGIAQALLNNPRLLIVDEPTAGLDPAERNRFYNLLSEVGENTIVILSSHIVGDIKELCTKMAIINQGKVVIQGNTIHIMETLQGRLYEKTINKNELEQYKKEYQVISERLYLGKQIVHVVSDNHPGTAFKPIEASLEDVYLAQIINP